MRLRMCKIRDISKKDWKLFRERDVYKRQDMDCFIPLMNKFYTTYGFYPKYPVADAGYGSYNNYIFCEQQGMEKYMKFPMFKKETTDKKYHEDPFRAVNFPIGEGGILSLIHI